MMISEETRNSIRKFCRELVSEYPEAQWDLNSPHMFSIIPDDIKNIDKSKGAYLPLFGKYFQSYNEALSKLRRERALEYLKERELKERFWHFVCEIIADYKTLRDITKLEAKINEFLTDISKPVIDFEVLIPILNIDMREHQINIGDVIIRKLNDQDLKKLGFLDTDIGHFLSEKFKLTDSTVVIVPEKGNNPELVVLRARNKADLIMRALQASLSTNPFLHEEEMLLKQGEFVIYRKRENPSEGGYVWQRGYEPIPIEINDNFQKVLKTLPLRSRIYLKKITPSIFQKDL